MGDVFTAELAGLRGPGLTGADKAYLDEAIAAANRAVGDAGTKADKDVEIKGKGLARGALTLAEGGELEVRRSSIEEARVGTATDVVMTPADVTAHLEARKDKPNGVPGLTAGGKLSKDVVPSLYTLGAVSKEALDAEKQRIDATEDGLAGKASAGDVEAVSNALDALDAATTEALATKATKAALDAATARLADAEDEIAVKASQESADLSRAKLEAIEAGRSQPGGFAGVGSGGKIAPALIPDIGDLGGVTIGALAGAVGGIYENIEADRVRIAAGEAALPGKASTASVTAVTVRAGAVEVRPDRVDRPGEMLAAYSLSVAGGDPAMLPKIDPSYAVVSQEGMVRRHEGSTLTREAAYLPIEDDTIAEVEIAVRRLVDVDSSVPMFVLYFTRDKRNHPDFGLPIDNARTLKRNDGLRTVKRTFSRSSALGADILLPPDVYYISGVVQTDVGETALDAVKVKSQDVTDRVALERAAAANAAAIVEEALATGARVNAITDDGIVPTCVRTPTSWASEFGSAFTGWGIYDDVARDDVVDGFSIYLKIPATVASWDVMVVSRPVTTDSDGAPGSLPVDVTHAVAPTARYAASAVPSISHTAVEEISRLDIAFARPLHRDAARNYAFMVRARNTAGQLVQIGRIAADTAGLTSFARGWTFGASGVLTKLVTAAATAGFVYRRDAGAAPVSAFAHIVGDPVVDGLSIDLRPLTVRDLNGLRPLWGRVLTATAANQGISFEREGYRLMPGAVVDFLDHANLSNVEVRLAGTTTLLARDVHYHLDEMSGRIFAIGSQGEALVDITYDWANERIDLIAEVPSSSTSILLPGIERVHSAHEDLYRAKPTDPAQRPLYAVRVVGSRIRSVTPVWDWIGTFSIRHHAEIDAQIRMARDALAPVRTKLERGDGIILSGYGSSLVEMGGGQYNDPSDFEPNRYTGTDGTDLGGPIGDFYGKAACEADLRAAYFGAQTPIMINGHLRYRIGPIWRIIDAIIATYGYTFVADRNPGPREITYLNQGIGATTMAATPGNCGDPARLAKLIDPSAWFGFRTPDLVVMDSGINWASLMLYAGQLDRVLAAIRGAGIPVLIYGPQMINLEEPVSIANRMTLHTWRAMHGIIRAVSLARGVAYMPMDMIQGPGREGYMGLTPASACRPNYGQHDGMYEERKRGEFLALAVLP